MDQPVPVVGCAGDTEAVVVVPFAGGVPVAIGGAHVPGFVVPGAAPKNTARAIAGVPCPAGARFFIFK